MATVSKRGTTVVNSSGTTWTTTNLAIDGAVGTTPATYAVFTNAQASGLGYISIGGFDFSSIPDGSTNVVVTMNLRHYVATLARWALVKVQAFDGTSALGAEVGGTLSATPTTFSQNFQTIGATLDNIKKPGFNFRVTAQHSTGTQSSTFNVDYVDVVVTYDAPVPAVTQDAYQFFDETGTESGAAPLAAQNTSVTGNLANGDGYGQIRVRLQSTSAVTVAATDDFQLQYEKNYSGTWVNVATGGTTVLPYDSPVLDTSIITMADSYVGTLDTTYAAALSNLTSGDGQSFMGNGLALSSIDFYMSKVGAPTHNFTAQLYNHTGTFGANGGFGIGAPLATSDPVLAASLVASPSYGWVNFSFPSNPVLASGVPYVIVVRTSFSSGTDFARLAFRNVSEHPGIHVTLVASTTWNNGQGDDYFRLYTKGLATTNRLTGGTGSFVPGKVSEDGHVDNVGWAGNNFTEILYSVKLVAADLAGGDTLRFRVVRNGVADLTYAVTPTITVVASPDRGVTTTAPVAAAVVTQPTTLVQRHGAVTTIAPVANATVTAPAVTVFTPVNGAVTTSAPVAAATITAPATSVRRDNGITTAAPVAVAVTSCIAGKPVESMHADSITVVNTTAGDASFGASFTVNVAGYITHIRLWHYPGNPVTSRFTALWNNATGAKLVEAYTSGESTAAGWVYAKLPSPYFVAAGTTLRVSYGHTAGTNDSGITTALTSVSPNLTWLSGHLASGSQTVFPGDVAAPSTDYTADVVFQQFSGPTVSVTTTAPVAAASVATPSATTATSGAVTVAAPVASALVTAPTTSVVRHGAVTITAPTAAATITAPTRTVSAGTTTTAPSASATVTSPTRSVSAGATTTAPTAAATVTAPTTLVQRHGAITVIAPVADTLVTAPTTSVRRDNGITISAPTAAATISAPTTSVVRHGAVTLTAPVADAVVTTPTISVRRDNAVTTVAPTALATVPTPTIGIITVGGVTITSPVAQATVGLPTWTVSSGKTTTAPVAAATVGTPTISVVRHGSVTTTAPVATTIVTAPGTGSVANGAVTTSAPVAQALVTAPTRSVSATRTTTAPVALAIVTAPTIVTTRSGAVTTTAPVAITIVSTPNVSGVAIGTNVSYWDGDEWINAEMQVWNGTAWVPSDASYWDGSVWVS